MIEIDIIRDSVNIITKNSEIFTSEQEFNIMLAYEFKKRLKPNYDVLIEYCTLSCFSEKEKDYPNYNYYLDIVIKNNEEFYPIQLKYSGFKGKECIGGTTGGLLASNFVKDIASLEKLRAKIPVFTKGYCLLLTNEDYILEPDNYIKNGVFANFIISPNTPEIGGKKLIHNRRDKDEKFEDPVIINKYPLQWSDIEIPSENFQNFKLLIVEIAKNINF